MKTKISIDTLEVILNEVGERSLLGEDGWIVIGEIKNRLAFVKAIIEDQKEEDE